MSRDDMISRADALAVVRYSKDPIEGISNLSSYEVVPVSVIKDYLRNVLDEWNALGDRKYELPNMQVYNHVRKLQDDLDSYLEGDGRVN